MRGPDEILQLETKTREKPKTIVSAGKIHLLGLDAVQARLGDKWQRMAELVHRYFEAAIRRELVPGDTFCHHGNSSYIVLFHGATLAEAQFKCRSIAEDVCRRLFGEEGEDLTVRSLNLPVDAVNLENRQDREHLDAQLERDGRESIFEPSSPEMETKPALIKLHLGDDGIALHSIPRGDACFLFRPLWDSARGAVLTYICQPLPDTAQGSMVFSGLCTSVNDEQDQTDLDVMILNECLRRVYHLRRSGLRVLLAAPLHFTTLSRTRFWTQYSALRKTVPSQLFTDIAFVVHGISASVPNIRMTAELPKLTNISKHVFCITDDVKEISQQFRNTGAHAVGTVVPKTQPERVLIEKLRFLSRAARDTGLESFVLGAERRSAAVNAIGAGIRYLEGPSVRATMADPRFAFVQEIEDLYRSQNAASF